MRLTTLLLITAILQVSAVSRAQKITLSEKNASIDKVFEKISNQTGYSFLFSTGTIKNANSVNIKADNMELKEVLELLFEDQPLDYKINAKSVVVSKKEPSFLSKVKEALSIPILVTGRVTDSTGMALPGATIKIKPSGKTVNTDSNGGFRFTAEEGAEVSVSFVGYQTAVFKVSQDMGSQNVILRAISGQLREIMVNTGYQSLPLERASGSFVQIDNNLLNRRVSTDLLSKLEGIVPGLIVNRNTVEGQNKLDINIHGKSTIFSNDQPLIVVDNFPYDGDLNNINPNNVESVTVLKDAAATSIWGARSGNGVIVITTKKGRQNQPLSIEVNGNLTIGDKPNLSYDPNFLDSKDYIELQKDFYSHGYYTNLINSKTNPLPPAVSILDKISTDPSFAAAGNDELNQLAKNDVRSDLLKYIYRKSVNQQYSINLLGGGSRSTYASTIGYDKDLSNSIGTQNDRISIHSSYEYFPTSNLKFTVGVHYTQSNNQYNTPGLGNLLYPYTRLADDNGNPLPIVRGYSDEFKAQMESAGYLNWQYIPLNEFKLLDNSSKTVDNLVEFGLGYKFPMGFSTSIKYQYENQLFNSKNDNSLETYYTRDLINTYTNLAADNKYPIPLGGVLDLGNGQLKSNQLRGQINYDGKLNDHQQLSALVGAEVKEIVNESSYGKMYGYDNSTGLSNGIIDYASYFPLTPASSGNARIPSTSGINSSTDHFISYFGTAGYTLLDKYILNISGRIDKSNLFGVNTNNKIQPLYSAGAAWNIDKESFFKINWISYLKLRVTYGYTGNINKTATGLTTINTSTSSQFSNDPFATITSPGNPELRWEKIRNINLGLDFSLKNQILFGALNYYWKNGLGLFGGSPLPSNTGNPVFFGNTANSVGHGIDITLSSTNRIGRDLRLTTNLIINQSIDKVSKYLLTNNDVSSTYINGSSASYIVPTVGKPLYGIYSFKSGGLTHDTGDPQGYLNGKLSTDYNAIIENTKNGDLVFNGSARPLVFGSFKNDVSYKSLTFSFNIGYKLDYYFRRSTVLYSSLANPYFTNLNKDYLVRWQKPGDEQITKVPSFQYPANSIPGREAFYPLTEDFVEKADNIRLQDIQITYDFRDIWKHGPFKNLQVYGYANNLGILWRANKKGLDPDLFGSSLPAPRTYSFGIKSNF